MSFNGDGYLHVPIYFILVVVTDTLRLNVTEDVNNPFYRLRDICCQIESLRMYLDFE